MSRNAFTGFAFMATLGVMIISLIVFVSEIKAEFATLKSEVAALKTSQLVSADAEPALAQSATYIRGWAVRIYEAPRQRANIKQISSQDYAGAFIHTGSWISLDDYKKHDGIFLSGEAALNLRGQFRPQRSGQYVFAVHMKIVSDKDSDQHGVPTVSCYARLLDQHGQELISGKMLVDGKRSKGALISKLPVAAGNEAARFLDLSFTCDGQPKLQGEKILFRLCFRKAEDPKFRPLVPSLKV